jgi:Sporulation lipoprotein YhcN/YlaJ (Spore_YhcN_YlaJ)
MKKLLILSFCAIFFLMTGCMQARMPDHKLDESLYQNRQNTKPYDSVGNQDAVRFNMHGGPNQIGYIRYDESQFRNADGTAAKAPSVYVDRTILARHIAHLETVLPNVKAASVLVTDNHIFVGVQTNNGRLDRKTIRDAWWTAASVTPRYFRIHVTSDAGLRKQIDQVGMRLQRGNYVEGARGDLEKLLERMGDKTPPDLGKPGRSPGVGRPGGI